MWPLHMQNRWRTRYCYREEMLVKYQVLTIGDCGAVHVLGSAEPWSEMFSKVVKEHCSDFKYQRCKYSCWMWTNSKSQKKCEEVPPPHKKVEKLSTCLGHNMNQNSMQILKTSRLLICIPKQLTLLQYTEDEINTFGTVVLL